MHFAKLVKGMTAEGGSKAQLGLGHAYSRAKVSLFLTTFFITIYYLKWKIYLRDNFNRLLDRKKFFPRTLRYVINGDPDIIKENCDILTPKIKCT